VTTFAGSVPVMVSASEAIVTTPGALALAGPGGGVGGMAKAKLAVMINNNAIIIFFMAYLSNVNSTVKLALTVD